MRIYFSIIILLFTFQGFSQEISGRAFYTSFYQTKDEMELKEDELNNPVLVELMEQLKKPFTDEYELEFSREESVFKKLPKLEKPEPTQGQISVTRSVMSDDEIHYKNLRENEYLNSKELYGKLFLIQDEIENKDWQLSKESKTIGDYVCFKATYVPKSDESDDSEEKWIKEKKDKKEIIAWYTPQIPVKNGPMKYDGLPGLILEVQGGNLKFLCTKIVINPAEKIEITAPKKGKKVSEKEFKAIVKEKNKDMMENFKSQKRRRD